MRTTSYPGTMAAALLAISLLAAAPAGAETPTQTLRQLNQKINKLLAKKPREGSPAEAKNKEEIKKVVNSLLDYEELAKLSLGRHWKERNEKERKEFTALLRDLIERNYVKQLRSNLGYKLEYRKESVAAGGDEAEVKTAIIITKNNRPTEILIDYKLRRRDGRWMVYDVVTDEVSIVKNYRSQFNRIIKKESYDALVKKMRRKLDEETERSEAKAS